MVNLTNGRYTVYEDKIILAEYKEGGNYIERLTKKLSRSKGSIAYRVSLLKRKMLAKDNNKSNIDIYLITTPGCQACAIQDRLLNSFNLKNNEKFKIIKSNFLDVPTFIRINVKLDDYPVTVIVQNDTIKYHFVGTKSIRELEQIFKDLKLK